MEETSPRGSHIDGRDAIRRRSAESWDTTGAACCLRKMRHVRIALRTDGFTDDVWRRIGGDDANSQAPPGSEQRAMPQATLVTRATGPRP